MPHKEKVFLIASIMEQAKAEEEARKKPKK
jgi:hypothetical protein